MVSTAGQAIPVSQPQCPAPKLLALETVLEPWPVSHFGVHPFLDLEAGTWMVARIPPNSQVGPISGAKSVSPSYSPEGLESPARTWNKKIKVVPESLDINTQYSK